MDDTNNTQLNNDQDETTNEEVLEKEQESTEVKENETETTENEAKSEETEVEVENEIDENVVEEEIQENDAEETTQENTETTASDSPSDDEEVDEESVIVINKKVSDSANWYVVHTYSGHESRVARSLKERVEAAGHSDKVFKIFLPHQQKIVVSEGKKRSIDEKLFPGYIVVLMDMSDDSWYIVRSTPGVTGFVGMGSTPTPLPKSEVLTLMKFAKMEAPKFEAKFRLGDSVKVNEGPFKDFLGKVDEVNEEQGKVKVLVSVFGRETPLELAFTQVSQL
jgi:transcription termination/antitermination protein NusG